jgi:PTH1 family peptidyl-tRNA hydrolase
LKAVFGLGNPGPEYALSRHNVGFQVIDLYRRVHCPRARGVVACHSLIYRADGLLLVKPLTYMNESGRAVQGTLQRYRVDPSESLVVYDDLDLPLGSLRILTAGGAGTHNGMRSVLVAVGGEEIPRLRIGINAEPRTSGGTDYVLGRFTPQEWQILSGILETAVEAIDAFSRSDIRGVMNRFNHRGSTIAASGDPAIN